MGCNWQPSTSSHQLKTPSLSQSSVVAADVWVRKNEVDEDASPLFNWKSARARWRALTMKMSPWLWRPCSCRIFWWVWRWQPELICLIISYTRYLDYVYTLHFESQLSWWFLGSAATTMPWVTAPKQSTIVRLSNVLKKIVPVATGSTATAAICSRTPVGPRIRLNSRKWVKVFFAWGQSRFSTFTKDFGKT